MNSECRSIATAALFFNFKNDNRDNRDSDDFSKRCVYPLLRIIDSIVHNETYFRWSCRH